VFGEVLTSAFFSVDDDEDAVDDRASVSERLHGVDCALACRGDVLQHNDFLAGLELAFYLVARSVLFGLLPNDDVRVAGLDGRRRDQRDGAQRDAGEFRVANLFGEGLSDEFQTVWVRLEDVLIDVILRGTAMGELELPEPDGLRGTQGVDEFLIDHTLHSLLRVKSGAES
jgi:hypothetical protein